MMYDNGVDQLAEHPLHDSVSHHGPVELKVIHEISVPSFGVINVPIVKGDFKALPVKVQYFIAQNVKVCQPAGVYLCDGSEEEKRELMAKVVDRGLVDRINMCANCYMSQKKKKSADLLDGNTWVVTREPCEAVPRAERGVKVAFGQWMSLNTYDKESNKRFHGSMKDRFMYVIPFSMGPIGSQHSQTGVHLTDFAHQVLCMGNMLYVSDRILGVLGDGEFMKNIHSVGRASSEHVEQLQEWKFSPDRVFLSYLPGEQILMGYGAGYGGTSLLAKTWLTLSMANRTSRHEGWLAADMLLLSITNPNDIEKYIAVALPSGCGRTSLIRMESSQPGWRVKCISDEITWFRFGEGGQLYGMNPENRFNTMQSQNTPTSQDKSHDEITQNSFGEKIDDECWQELDGGNPTPETESVFNTGVTCKDCQVSNIHERWNDPEGFPVEAIVFGSRRSSGVPLVYEAFNWRHGVMVGASVKSQLGSTDQHTENHVSHQPMATDHYVGYNFGDYLQQWLDMERSGGRKMPKIFHVNWFRMSEEGEYLWPGFGENIRIFDWILKRCEDESEGGVDTAIGIAPKHGSINRQGLGRIEWDELMSVPKDYWKRDMEETTEFLQKQLGEDLPAGITKELEAQQQRVNIIKS